MSGRAHSDETGKAVVCPYVTIHISRVTARILVVVLASVVLVLAGVGAYKATVQGAGLVPDPSQAVDVRFERTRIEALRAEFVARVPTGSRMYIDPGVVWGKWGQRLGEFAAMNGVSVVTDAEQADYQVSVVAAPDTRIGLRLTVERAGLRVESTG